MSSCKLDWSSLHLPELKVAAWLLLALLLGGCQPVHRSIQPQVSQEAVLQPGMSIGQSFVAGFGGLEGIQLFLDGSSPSDGAVVLHLRSDALSNEDIRVSRLPLEQLHSPGYYTFSFSPIPRSQRQYYYAFFEIEGRGEVGVRIGPAGAYTEGAFFADHTPADAQAAFRLSYAPLWLLAGLVGIVLVWVGVLLTGALLFVLPGLALLSWIKPRGWDWPGRLALSAGLSLALLPILMLWTDLIGLRLGALYAWLLTFIGLVWVVATAVRRILTARQTDTRAGKQSPTANDPILMSRIPSLALLAVLALIIFTRFWPVRLLEAPMWGDSVQHTVMAQLILDHDGLFSSWQPYAPYSSLTVQYGFSAAAAAFAWLTGQSSLQSTIWTGQLVNFLAVLALYPLAVRLAGGSRWAGVFAVLAAGLLSPTPAVYTNWGRYAQLAGQAILPAALWLLWETLDQVGSRTGNSVANRNRSIANIPWRPAVVAALALAGMTLTYYRMPFYYATFGAALVVGWALPKWKLDFNKWSRGTASALVIALGAAFLCLPWALRVAGGQLAGTLEAGISSGSALQSVLEDYRTWSTLSEHLPFWLAATAALSVVLALVLKQWLPAAIGLWAAALASLVALSLLRIPGANMMQNFAVIIAMYMPAALLAGWLASQFTDLPILHSLKGQALIAGIVILAGLVGVWSQRSLIKPSQYSLVTRPDMRAMAWIRQNLPPDSRFLVEGFTIYEGYTAVGSDAGWWLPLVAGRENTMPPQYALMNEQPVQPGYTTKVVELVSHLEQESIATPASRKLLCQWGITHAYIGQGQGQVSLGGFQLFTPQDFLSSPFFKPVYNQDRVVIFEHDLENCEEPGN